MAGFLQLEDGASGNLLLQAAGGLLLEPLETLEADAPGALGAFRAFADLRRLLLIALEAEVTLGSFSSVSSLEAYRNTVIDAQVSMGSFRAPALIGLLLDSGVARYVETQHPSLLGNIDLATGPGGCLLVAASKSRAVCFVTTTDPRGVYVSHVRQFAKQPRALASTAWFWFVLLDETTEADPQGQPELLAFPQTGFTAEAMGRAVLPRGRSPQFLWAPGADPTALADFLVVGDSSGRLQLRRADATMALLISFGPCGLQDPGVAAVVRLPALEHSEAGKFVERAWGILLFSRTGAKGRVLVYRERAVTPWFGGLDPFETRSLRVADVFEAEQCEGALQLLNRPSLLGGGQDTTDFTLAVERYEQLQRWSVAVEDGEAVVRRVAMGERYRGLGLAGADRLPTPLTAPPTAEDDVAHTHERQAADPIASPSHHWPRSRAIRIPGGYALAHGDVGRLSRIRTGPLVGSDATLGAFTGAAALIRSEEIDGDSWFFVDTITLSNLKSTSMVYFQAGAQLNIGEYLLRYLGGAVDYDGAGGVPPQNYVVHAGWGPTFGCGFEMGPNVVHSGGTQVQAPGNNLNYATIAACESANAGAIRRVTTTAKATLGIYIRDCFPSDNVGAAYIYELWRKVPT